VCRNRLAKTTTNSGRALFFTRQLKQEGRLGFWRWTSILLGVAGTYRQDDWVDLVYETNGQRTVKTRLQIAPVKPKKATPRAAASPPPTTEAKRTKSLL
jgi:hypothetical protein